ncbi:DMT family transporter [Plantactinospora sp. KLBMP9567]|uniref:DMT family transporter n=1 Tax=Plantactinospora sp. KLBMP9567 TaxID=3085900 RepID=UPI002980E5D9|nr:DMT family transporter [Plantactinospora sp. KLBMP9567]MDW5322388.1 DMT family transporter [Plantactinospora sp. KLBMP9567]
MNQGAQLALGTTLAVAAAAAFGTSSVLQYRANQGIPQERVARPKLLWRLLHRRNWRWSVLLAAAAFGLQAAALTLVPLILVQSVLVTGLLWYVLLLAALERHRPDGPILLESLLCLVGLSAFLLIAAPAANRGRGLDSIQDGAWLAAGLVGAVAGCLLLAARLGGRWRPLPLAAAAGTCYGVTAGLISSLAHTFDDGPVAVLGHWQTYGIVVLGPIGVLLSQNAYQAGPLGAPALATFTVTDPLVSMAVGLLWLDERIRTGTWSLVGELAALGGLVVGVFLLARRAPRANDRAAAARGSPKAVDAGPGESPGAPGGDVTGAGDRERRTGE